MRRVGNLYEKIADPDNLRLAFLKASRGKQQRSEVIHFRQNFEKNIYTLHHQLLTGNYDIGNYYFFHVNDPKRRLICAASFPERVLHHGIMNVCEPVLEKFAIFDSYACRRKKGLRKAILRCQCFSRRQDWFLKLDIHKYFDTIDHQRMFSLLSRRLKDQKLLGLFSALLSTYNVSQGKGVPIGNLVSQHMANFYLGVLDHWIKESRRCKGYLRYMDDFGLFGDNTERPKIELEAIQCFLEDELYLRVKSDLMLNRSTCGVPFLGFRIMPSVIRLGSRSKNRFVEKIRAYERWYGDGLWSEEKLSSHVTPLIEFTKNGDSFSFRQNILQRYGVES